MNRETVKDPFKRCPSCRCAVGAFATRCVLCETHLLPDNDPALSDAPEHRVEKEYFWINIGAAIAVVAMFVSWATR